MWYNLLYVELNMKIEGKISSYNFLEYTLKEELLWDKRNKEPNDIKKIMAEIIRRNLINEEDPSKYQKRYKLCDSGFTGLLCGIGDKNFIR